MSNPKMEGGAMGGVEDLYREVILDHFKTPRNKGALEKPTAKAEGMNPLCGDQITISAVLEDGKVKDLKFEGHGCAISQSSASMMTAALKGKSAADAEEFTTLFKQIFGVEKEKKTKFKADDLGDLEALEGVKKYPVRIKCALLAWNTLIECLKGK